MTTAVEAGGTSGTQPDRAWRELLQLHRSAVMQADPDLSDLFEQRMAKYRESLLNRDAEASFLTKDSILDFAAMHGIISSRRHKSEWSQKFNASLVGFAASVTSAAARGIEPTLMVSTESDTREALRELLAFAESKICHHEETRRGGVLWTICESCGMKWADDAGGLQPAIDPPAVVRARAILAKHEADNATE